MKPPIKPQQKSAATDRRSGIRGDFEQGCGLDPRTEDRGSNNEIARRRIAEADLELNRSTSLERAPCLVGGRLQSSFTGYKASWTQARVGWRLMVWVVLGPTIGIFVARSFSMLVKSEGISTLLSHWWRGLAGSSFELVICRGSTRNENGFGNFMWSRRQLTRAMGWFQGIAC